MLNKLLNNLRWGVVFLVADARLREDDRNYVTKEAIFMSYNNLRMNDIKTDSIEGRITSKGYSVLGAFVGKKYEAEMNVGDIHGKVKVSFIVSDRTNGESLN